MPLNKIAEKKNKPACNKQVVDCSNNLLALEVLKKFIEKQLDHTQKALAALDVDWMQLCNLSQQAEQKVHSNPNSKNQNPFGDSTELNTVPLSLDVDEYRLVSELPSDLEDDSL